ncbi:MAG: hypothetical protein KJ843_16210 [Alphaproteobacteria bacterium]|nr:hypothetical protein [Alphaproteobacteria bacterium]MBU2388168.1 hypothetical protein [Alphaproteobacteria bacterium]
MFNWNIIRSGLRMTAALLVMLNLFGMHPAFATSFEECGTISGAHDHDPTDDSGIAGCCGDVHCCPTLASAAEPDVPLAIRFQPQSFTQTTLPLRLAVSIDPPPRISFV